jgi:hypothetical protein
MISRLYKGLAKNEGFSIYRTDKFGKPTSEFTREFQIWMVKLNDLSSEQIAAGAKKMEDQIVKDSSEGVRSYPPSYAEFKGLCVISAKKAAHKMRVALPPPILSDEEKAMRMKEIRMRFGL